jgi:hypothetical protein
MSDETTHMAVIRAYAKVEQKINHLTRIFVTTLNGRYRKHVSDEFLVSILSKGVFAGFNMRPKESFANIAYDVGCNVFETTLERDCKAGGNGHHVAQDYSKMFNDFENEK